MGLDVNVISFFKSLKVIPDSKMWNYKNVMSLFAVDTALISKFVNAELPIWIYDFILLVVNDGELCITLNYKKFTVSKNSVFSFYGKNILNKFELSDDFDGYIIVSDAVFFNNSIMNSNVILEDVAHAIKCYPLLIYGSIDFIWLNKNIERLKSNLKNTANDDSKLLIENILLYFVVDIVKHSEECRKKELKNNHESLVDKYIELIYSDFKKERSVKYYASQLNVNPVKMSYIIKTVLGINPFDIVNDAIISESKILLMNYDITIGEIARELGYYDQSAFFKFFVNKVGQKPLEYRKKCCRFIRV